MAATETPSQTTSTDPSQPLTVDKTDTGQGLTFARHFTHEGIHPYDEVTWELRDAVIKNWRDGTISFEQNDVEFPSTWSMNATTIVAQKYFRGTLGTPQRESSVKQMIDRVADTITGWGRAGGYFTDEASAEVFNAELKHLLVNQKAAFNSPVWFNVGTTDKPQCSACFILQVEDTMSSILNWYVEEGTIFKGGSGAGINLSNIRSSREILKGGGEASGPVSFMRGADASAGTIKSGGKTRRAAKMVILDVDHPDVEEFIWTKAREEEKIRVLREAGFDMDLDSPDYASVQYQNANNSVRVTDEFMEAWEAEEDYDLKAVTTGEVVERKSARDVMRQFAEATWACADPGMQYDTTINDWHTTPNSGRINGSNPCSEYMHLDNSACNLASLNLKKFFDYDEGLFDVESFKRAVEVIFTAQEIIVGFSSYPTEAIGKNANDYRQLGLGYANIGGLLMSLGLPYDSDEGRAFAGAITALMTGHAYAQSAKYAQVVGPFAGYEGNEEPMLRVIGKHRAAVDDIDAELAPTDLLTAARDAWDTALAEGGEHGFRNAQASVLAPTGTIGLMMDCDTTGIEPDLGLVKMKKLVGGGSMMFVNQTVPQAMKSLGYTQSQIDQVIAYIDENKTILDAPELKDEHVDVFQCAMGDNAIHYMGHVRMMAAAQPFISGAISKTVNLPEEATVEDIEQLHVDAWKLGIKAIAIYRDNCKVAQPLSVSKKGDKAAGASATPAGSAAASAPPAAGPVRRKLPKQRPSQTISFRVGDAKGYLTAGEYPGDGLGEVFVKLGKQGSTLSGLLDAFAIAVSIGLQYGVPLETFVRKFMNMRFEPAGMTDDPEIRFSASIIDYAARKLAIEYLPYEEREALGIFTLDERTGMLDDDEPTVPTSPTAESVAKAADLDAAAEQGKVRVDHDAPMCYSCGIKMKRAGSCHVCESCGTTSGCS
ncbi:vitamin B12-dependent ribonucleotide reductase [Salsipaludibacter albus]|uniref:vitamin B12-dependent ribonucleotide reductase n=1 Tax=Salsipaludibacter albus TaxID=2849650 RepID=UPI001EE40DFE|nr:vitamin B12-dependent ribonucleotide reductase [Salsipaludibacter albus]MBY5163444.1 vitamin B12-dependent ribonucleotide reductase [Salsipaludibacter albus]